MSKFNVIMNGNLLKLRQGVWDEDLYHESVSLFKSVANNMKEHSLINTAFKDIIIYWTAFVIEITDYLVSHDIGNKWEIIAELENSF